MDRLDDLAIARLKNDYIAGKDRTQKELWDRLSRLYKISVPTIRRYAKAGDWETLRQASLGVQQKVIQKIAAAPTEVAIAGEVIATDKMLDIIISDGFAAIQSTPSRSKEAMIASTLKALELRVKLYPRSMDEFIDLALSIPGFDVREFARKLRERIERSA